MSALICGSTLPQAHRTPGFAILSVKWRDLVATRMTPAQIAEAQRMAREWKPK